MPLLEINLSHYINALVRLNESTAEELGPLPVCVFQKHWPSALYPCRSPQYLMPAAR
jgi:hypothetical protein